MAAPFTPTLMIAVPQMGDPNFARSVVLMLHHSIEGAMGLVINQATNLNLGTFARSEKLPIHHDLEAVPVYRGGPVEPERGWILHQNSGLTEKQEILPEVLLSGSSQSLHTLLEDGHTPLRFILGYAGWSAGQLESEMTQGAWISAPASAKYIFQAEPLKIWETVLKDMGVNPASIAVGGGIH